jgi:porin
MTLTGASSGRVRRRHARRSPWLVLGLLASLWAPTVAPAQVQAPETFAGDLWSRPRLTGDWFGIRDEMAKRGVTFDVDLLNTLQGVMTGGRDTAVGYWGTADYTLNVDTGKLGLWPGGFLKVHAMSGFGESVNTDAGALVPVNFAGILPSLAIDNQTSALMNLSFAQFLSPWFGVFAGKVEGFDGDANEFADDYRTKFMNTGFDFNLVNVLAPLSAVGGGIILLPWQGAMFTLGVLDPSGRPTDTFGAPFKDGVFVAAEGRVTIKPFGLLGHQLVGFNWSNKERTSLIQDPSNFARLLVQNSFPRLADPGPILRRIVERFFPQLLVPTQALNTENESWALYYNFDQYLWSPKGDPTRGIGVFFRFGVSDGDANPIKYFYSAGIGGKGVVPGRPRDTFGIGWSRADFSKNLVPLLRDSLDLGLNHEDTVELYYNAALTGWLNVSVDLQIVNPGLKKTLGSDGALKDVNTAVIGGLRVYTRF